MSNALKEADKATERAENADALAKSERKHAEAKGNSSAQTNSTSSDEDDDGTEADGIAAIEDEEKAKKLMKYAKNKVQTVVDSYVEMKNNIQFEFENLNQIMLGLKVNANFDADSAQDIEWVATEVEKSLMDTPQVKSLEDKLGMAAEKESELTEAVGGLEKVLNITQTKLFKRGAKHAATNATSKSSEKENKSTSNDKDTKNP